LLGNFTWTHREFEWYFAENRFLFAAEDESECDRWVCVLNWLLTKIEQELNPERYPEEQPKDATPKVKQVSKGKEEEASPGLQYQQEPPVDIKVHRDYEVKDSEIF